MSHTVDFDQWAGVLLLVVGVVCVVLMDAYGMLGRRLRQQRSRSATRPSNRSQRDGTRPARACSPQLGPDNHGPSDGSGEEGGTAFNAPTVHMRSVPARGNSDTLAAPAGRAIPGQWSEHQHAGAPRGTRETTWPPASRAVGSTPTGGCRGVSAGGANGQPVRLRPSSAPEARAPRRDVVAGVALVLLLAGLSVAAKLGGDYVARPLPTCAESTAPTTVAPWECEQEAGE